MVFQEGNVRPDNAAKLAAKSEQGPVIMQGVLTIPESSPTLEDVAAIQTAIDKQKDKWLNSDAYITRFF